MRYPSISLWVEFPYGQASRLHIGDRHIMSTTGVRQGNPLGSLLFARVLHPLIHQVRDNCNILLHVWYLDHETIIRDLNEAVKGLTSFDRYIYD